MNPISALQICFIGDSVIEQASSMRSEIAQQCHGVSFIGPYSDVLGFAHAGWCGQTAQMVLARSGGLPRSKLYVIHCGTNGNAAQDELQVVSRSSATAMAICELVQMLTLRNSNVLLYPLPTNKKELTELHSRTNASTNEVLHRLLPECIFLDPIPGIDLHPSADQYSALAGRDLARFMMRGMIDEPGSVSVIELAGYCENGFYCVSFETKPYLHDDPEVAIWDQQLGAIKKAKIGPWDLERKEVIFKIDKPVTKPLTLKCGGFTVFNALWEKLRPTLQSTPWEEFVEGHVTPLEKGESR